MMTSFSLQREEEERETAKNSKQAESLACTTEHTFPQVRSSTIHDFTNALLPS